MKKSFASLCLVLTAVFAASPALCAVKTATFQTSLTILESCRVDGSHGAPVVSCQMASSAVVTAAAMHAGPAADGAPFWVVTF